LFDDATQDDGVTVYDNWIYVNNTITGLLNNMTYYLYNSTSELINSSFYPTDIYEINWTNLADGLYFYNITVRDIYGNESSTETRNITIDASTNVSLCKYVFLKIRSILRHKT